MKKLNTLLIIAVLVSGAIFAQDAEYSITLTADTSTAILPPRDNRTTITGLWTASTVVANGEIYRVQGTQRDYMVLVAGTTGTSAPTGVAGQVETNGTATLIHCNYVATRTMAHVTQEANASIWYHTSLTATTNGGEFAYLKGQQYRTDSKEAVSVISPTAVKLNIMDR